MLRLDPSRWARALAWAVLTVPATASASDIKLPANSIQIGGLSYAGAPFTGYDDKSGWLFGGAGFVYRDSAPAINASLFAVSNGNDFHSATLNIEQRSWDRWSYQFHGLAERAFDIYYGEGDLTDPSDPRRMTLFHFEAQPAVLYRVRPHLRLGVFDDYRDRMETAVERVGAAVPGDPTRLFPDESSDAFGLRTIWDDRDSLLSSHSGDYVQVDLSCQPQSWTTLDGATGFAQLKVDLRRFRRLRKDLVLALRTLGGTSFGEPGYLFRYRLGGLDALRGYKDNRFRGKDMVVLQQELRWTLWERWLALSGSADLGAIGDGPIHQLKATVTAGLRLGLPPDGKQKIRVDLGYGQDQETFQIQFGEIF